MSRAIQVSSRDLMCSVAMIGNNTSLYTWKLLSVLTTTLISSIVVIISQYMHISNVQAVHHYIQFFERVNIRSKCTETWALLLHQRRPGEWGEGRVVDEVRDVGVEVRCSPVMALLQSNTTQNVADRGWVPVCKFSDGFYGKARVDWE